MSLGTGGSPYNFPAVTIGSRTSIITNILVALAITDTNNHFSSILSNPAPYRKVTVIVNHTLNQQAVYRLFGSKDNTQSGGSGTLLDHAYTITGGTSQPSDATIAASSGWIILFTLNDFHPYLQLRVAASVAPASGVSDIWSMVGN